MEMPVVGKSYLWVACKSCSKHFRVVMEPLFEGKQIEVKGPQTLTCRGCGVVHEYQTTDMVIATFDRQKKAR
jgi:RNase P subunit RPR2